MSPNVAHKLWTSMWNLFKSSHVDVVNPHTSNKYFNL